jgi:hypothetical protein
MPTLVTEISRHPSASSTGNSVVKFEYNATRYPVERVKHCSVWLHNTWLDADTKDHYPVGSYVDILDCDPANTAESCETDESIQYRYTLGVWLVSAAAFVALLVIVFTCVTCCRSGDQPEQPPAEIELPAANEIAEANNEKRQEENEAVAVAVSASNHAYALASVSHV